MSLLDRIAITTNEINPAIEEAIKIGVSWGVRNFEIRDVWGRPTRIPRITPEQEQIVYNLYDSYGVTCTALSPGTFRAAFTPEANEEDFEHLENCCRIGKRLGTNMIITFSFSRGNAGPEENMPKENVKVLREAAQRAEDNGMLLVLENMPGQWADTAENSRRVLEAVDHPAFKFNWDPASAAYASEDPVFPEGYEAVKDFIVHFHLKNLSRDGDNKEWVRLSEGEVCYPAHIERLLDDSYAGYFLIETHCQPVEDNSRANLAYLRGILANLEANRKAVSSSL